jgi:RNA polymerase-associated protein CTR9
MSLSGARDLVIPVQASTLGVAVSLDALPDDETEVLQVLQAEQAPLGLWLDFARAYLQQGKEAQGLRVLEDGCSPGSSLAVHDQG